MQASTSQSINSNVTSSSSFNQTQQTNPTGPPQTSMNSQQASNIQNFQYYTNTLVDPSANDEMKLKAAQELSSSFEVNLIAS